ncbi:MAG TPA: hypothetical protein VN922_15585, partial [Bacteroidia bacterium]|nr:hypothetical protein [Bacteroidia bacterium]
MNLMLSYCKVFTKELKSIWVVLVLLPVFGKAQTTKLPQHKPITKQIQASTNQYSFGGGLRTAGTATCPTNPVALAGQDTLGNTVSSGQIFKCNATPFYVYVPAVSGNIASPCIQTEFTNFHTNMGTDGTETFYEGGVDIGCIGPSAACAFPIGGGTALNNTPWGLILSLLDPGQAHEFTLCRTGTISTSTVTLVDCWTNNTLPATPASTIYSNGTTTSGGTCDTIKLAAGTDIGTAIFGIAPSSASVALTDFHDGEGYINTALLSTGTYTVNYSFTPPAIDGCSTVTGTFMF